MTKKVLIFSISYYPFVGGAEVAVRQITDRLPETDWQMLTLSHDSVLPKHEQIGNIKVTRVRCPKIFSPFVLAWYGHQLHKKENFDVVWSIMSFAGFAGLFLKILKPRIKFLLTLQEGTPTSELKRKTFLAYPLFVLMFKKADMIQAISEFLAAFGRDMGHTRPIQIIPNGVDVSLFSKVFTPSERAETEKILGKKNGDIFLVTSSRLTYKNAIDDIINALKNLPENISLIVIGKGEQGCSLQRQVDCLGLQSRVKFLGFIPQNDIPKYFSVCDIFVRPSRSEGFGNSFIEAMAARLPVIATPIGGILDFIDDRETGIFCSPDNPQSIVLAVKTLVENPKLRDHIVALAFQRVSDRYSWNLIAKEMKTKVFDTIL
jgi:glycosyltransferase involved in cell wall biosynthesis